MQLFAVAYHTVLIKDHYLFSDEEECPSTIPEDEEVPLSNGGKLKKFGFLWLSKLTIHDKCLCLKIKDNL